MFKSLKATIDALNTGVKNVANSKKAIKLRKKLLTIGISLLVVGSLGVFVCFVLFATAGSKAFGPSGFAPRVLVPFFLFIPFGAIANIGRIFTTYGFKIVVVGYSTNLIDETIVDKCHNCGENINDEMNFCTKCGVEVRKKCSKCDHINNYKYEYCEKCGNEL